MLNVVVVVVGFYSFYDIGLITCHSMYGLKFWNTIKNVNILTVLGTIMSKTY